MGNAPLTLAIETSNPTAHDGAAGVALVRAGGSSFEVLASGIIRSENRHDDALMPEIDRIVRDAGCSPGDLERVAVSVGPGGYTSTRIAVTTAKIICRFTGARAVPVPTELGVLAALEPSPSGVVTVCLAWKRDEVWVRTFASGSCPADAPPGRTVAIESIADEAFGVLVCDDQLRERLTDLQTLPSRFDPIAVARASVALEAVDPMELAVVYPREPEAVRKWRAMGR